MELLHIFWRFGHTLCEVILCRKNSETNGEIPQTTAYHSSLKNQSEQAFIPSSTPISRGIISKMTSPPRIFKTYKNFRRRAFQLGAVL